jgi:hypothetical protein
MTIILMIFALICWWSASAGPVRSRIIEGA